MENKNLNQLISEWSEDFEKYPLPICFEPQQEQRELFKRSMKIKEDAIEFLANTVPDGK